MKVRIKREQLPNHDDCIEYLIKTSSVLLDAASILIEMRIRKPELVKENQ